MTVLKVSKVSNPHSVAGAIAGLVRDNGHAIMQAIGASATNQAVKAIAIARSFMREEGIDLLTRITFLDVEFGGETRTALRFEISDRVTFPESETPVDPSAAIGTINTRTPREPRPPRGRPVTEGAPAAPPSDEGLQAEAGATVPASAGEREEPA